MCVEGVRGPGDFWGSERGEGSGAGDVKAAPGVWVLGLAAHTRRSHTCRTRSRKEPAALGQVVFGLADQWIAFCAAHSSLPLEAVCVLQVWEHNFIPLQLQVYY